MLQWGRDQLIAEISSFAARIEADLLLQWGRDQLIAEIARGVDKHFIALIASMGPRSIDRGNIFPDMQTGFAALLQWGRDQLIAEIGSSGAAGRKR